MLIFNVLPLSISADLYRLFLGVVAASPQYWLYLLLIPVAAVLPDFYFRAIRRCVMQALFGGWGAQSCERMYAWLLRALT